MYLLDTMVISEEAKRRPNENVTSWLRRTESNLLFVSVVSIGEIERGIARQRRQDPQFARRLDGWLHRTERRFADRLLPIDLSAAKLWGQLWDRLGFNGPDLLIAATARRHDLIVVTRNVRHFEHTGVEVQDPYLSS
jgi:predicted nucleic acid-binding protein